MWVRVRIRVMVRVRVRDWGYAARTSPESETKRHRPNDKNRKTTTNSKANTKAENRDKHKYKDEGKVLKEKCLKEWETSLSLLSAVGGSSISTEGGRRGRRRSGADRGRENICMIKDKENKNKDLKNKITKYESNKI